MERQLHEDLGLLVRLNCVAAVALSYAVWPSRPLLIVLVLSLVVWPFSITAPMRWRNEIDDAGYARWATLLVPSLFVLFPGAFGESRGSEFPTVALMVVFGCAHLVLVLLLSPPVEVDFRRLSLWLAASCWGIAGALADLPAGLGWHTFTFFLYGLIAAQGPRQVSTRGVV